jgi:uncharacterized caspase-like protein
VRAIIHVSCVVPCLVALVVGNAAYQSIVPLRTPGKNPRKLTAVLEGLGFEATQARDADLARLQGLIDEFARRCRDAEVAVFFYSGHAVQIEDRLYLLPADIGLTADTNLNLAAPELEAVLRAMEASRVMRIAFLDAGRGNPWRFAAAAKAEPLPGLATLRDKAGLVVRFATSLGKSFEEGDGPLTPTPRRSWRPSASRASRSTK